ncbi:MerR, DNA binding [Bacillus sp. UNCCL13]|nr:MerR, DNA binding [Bacillus sp. UNCCL13]
MQDLEFIEACKSMHFPLDEIKRKLEIKKNKIIRDSEVEEQINAVAQQMKQLHNEINVLLPLIENMNEDQRKVFSKNINSEGSALMKSLLNLTS